MKLSHLVKISASFLLLINLIIAFGAIWLFMRVVPAIDLIVKNNVSSLEACQIMLTSLSSVYDEGSIKKNLINFEYGLKKARENVAVDDEKVALGIIKRSYKKAFNNDIPSKKEVIFADNYLAEINAKEILRLKHEAKQVSERGAWGVVFMAGMMFFLSLLFLYRFDKKLLHPIEELYHVMKALKNDDKLRRCSVVGEDKDIKLIFDQVNKLLDERIKYE